MIQEDELAVGDKARKVGQDYETTGTVVAKWKELDDRLRYVLRYDNPKGFLVILEPQQVRPIVPSELEKNVEVFNEILPSLLPLHKGKWALIYAQTLIDVFPDYRAAIGRGYEEFGMKPYHVFEITEKDVYVPISR